ncbi:uncharacterized protein LOC126550531 [Aphis gossypii]|uniref:uncharacterized protein LOC126550531 n=1 Tax=Aphis gossypii TaxID=80765 RepID=UPI0021593D3F|nr:uncharacterized protein LOC126550531 [Aphis gossypii]
MEPLAIKEFENIKGKTILPCGLMIDQDFSWFNEDNGLVEIKCPYSAKDYTNINDAIIEKKINFLRLNLNKEPELKKTHDYYYQIQGQLHISKKKYCDFIVYSSNWLHVETIYYNNEFWINVMQPKLTKFYLNCLLPEIVIPQYGKRLLVEDIKDPKEMKT